MKQLGSSSSNSAHNSKIIDKSRNWTNVKNRKDGERLKSNICQGWVRTLTLRFPGANTGRGTWSVTRYSPRSAHGFFFFLLWPIFKVFIEFVTILLLYLLSFFCCKSCRTLAPWPGSEPAPPALRGEVLNTEPLKKSLHKGLNEDALSEAVCFCCLIKSPDSWWETQDGEENRIEPWQPSILWYNFIDSFTTLLWGQLSVLHNSRVTKNVCKETNVS